MQLCENIGFLAASGADNIDEDSEAVVEVNTDEPAMVTAAASEPVQGQSVELLCPCKRGVESIDAVELSRLLTEQSANTVVVDCRPYLAYSTSHVVGAHNVCYPSLLERRRRRRQAAAAAAGNRLPLIPLENIVRCAVSRTSLVDGRCQRIVVYDEDTICTCRRSSVHVDTASRHVRASALSSSSQIVSILCSLADCTSCQLLFLQGLLSQTSLYSNISFVYLQHIC